VPFSYFGFDPATTLITAFSITSPSSVCYNYCVLYSLILLIFAQGTIYFDDISFTTPPFNPSVSVAVNAASVIRPISTDVSISLFFTSRMRNMKYYIILLNYQTYDKKKKS
jgi:hypothetical protein